MSYPTMGGMEKAFRRDLRACIDFSLWVKWHETRKIFADWLLEQGREAEAALTRAQWAYVGPSGIRRPKRDGMAAYRIHTFRALSAKSPANNYVMLPYTNASWLLHFSPRTLRLKGQKPPDARRKYGSPLDSQPPWVLYFTWMDEGRSSGMRGDTFRHPDGFAGLFLEWDGKTSRKVVPLRFRETKAES